jgi:mannitol 2-dehydrogenase
VADLVPRAQRSRTDPLAFVADPELFGTLAQEPLFTEPYLSALESLRSKGARATLAGLLA